MEELLPQSRGRSLEIKDTDAELVFLSVVLWGGES